jgi:hypothetical protein
MKNHCYPASRKSIGEDVVLLISDSIIRRIRTSRHLVLWVGAVIITASSTTVLGAARPTVTITPTAVTASGVTPGADVVFFGVGLEPKVYSVSVHRWAGVVTDTGRTGTVSFALDAPVSWNVVWVVADLQSGHYAVMSTPGFSTVTPFSPRFRLRRGSLGPVSRMSYSRSSVECLYVQTGGAWTLRAEDGTDSDADGTADGETTIDLLHGTQLLAGSQIPRLFSPAGTLFVVDTSRLDLLTVAIDAPLIAGAGQ